jgi:hypothetical protein
VFIHSTDSGSKFAVAYFIFSISSRPDELVVTHSFSPRLFAAPFNLPPASNDLFHPQPKPRGDAKRQGYQALQRPAKHLSQYHYGDNDANT